MRALRQVRVSLHPVVAVHMYVEPTDELAHAVLNDADLGFQVHPIGLGAVLNVWPIEEIAVECDEDERFDVANVCEEAVK